MKYTGITESGKTVTIWNDSQNGKEIWRWAACYDDGSGKEFDWTPSLATCKKDAPTIIGRWKRVKDTVNL